MAREQKQLEQSSAQVERRLKSFEGTDDEQDELLEIALDLAANCRKTCAKASPQNKRLVNQTFFEKVLIFSNDGERDAHAHLNPWTLVFRTSNVAENKAIGFEHDPTEVQAVEGEILQEAE